jgi:hypothetical protein
MLADRGDEESKTLTRLYIYDDNTVKTEDIPKPDGGYFPEIIDRSYNGFFATESGYTAVYKGNISPDSLTFDFYNKDFALTKTVKSDFQFDSFMDLLYSGTDYYMLCNKQGESVIAVFDESGEYIDTIKPKRGARINAIAISPEGQLVYGESDPGRFNMTVRSYGDKEPFEFTTKQPADYLINGGMGYAAFGLDGQYIYGYKENGITDIIMPISDLEGATFSYIVHSTGGDVKTAFTTDIKTGKHTRNTYTLKMTEPDNRQILTLSTDNELQFITMAVAAFNKKNTEYKVEITALDDRENPEISGFDKALIGGTLGDIIIPPADGNENYIEKGIYADLYEFLDNDPDISRDVFIPQVLSALETDGKLLRLWNSFSIETYYIPDGGLPPTYENIKTLILENPDKYILPIYPESRDKLLYELLKYNASYFVNQGELDGNELRDLLLICKNAKMPSDTSDIYAKNNIDDFYSRFENGKGYYKSANIFWIDTIIMNRETQTMGTAHSVAAGNPVPAGTPKNYIIGRDVAINNASPNKAAAWEFVKFYACYDPYEDSIFPHSDYFPLLKSRFDKFAKEAVAEADALRAENGNDYTNREANFNGARYPFSLLRESDLEELYALLDNAVVPAKYDMGLLVIITEEAAPYFADRKTLDETLDIIKSRADIYISEHQ